MTTTTKTINVAKDFNPEPIGRYPEDGDFNGQRFRTEYLVPALAAASKVIVDFDGTEGYGSSFLEEAFGGLVRKERFHSEELHRRLKVQSTEDDTVIEEVWQYIDTASPAVDAHK